MLGIPFQKQARADNAAIGTVLTGTPAVHFVVLMSLVLSNLIGPLLNVEVPGIVLWGALIALLYHHFIVSTFSRIDGSSVERGPIFIGMAFIVLCLWRFIQYYWSADPAETIKEAMKTIILVIFIFSVYYRLRLMPLLKLKRLSMMMVTLLLLASFVAYLWLLIRSGDNYFMYGARDFKKNIIIYGGSNSAGTVVLLLGLWNWIVVFSNTAWHRVVGICNTLLTVFLLIGIASYASFAGYIVSLMAMILMMQRGNMRKLILIITAFAIGMVALGAIFSDLGYLLNIDDNYLRTGYQRADLWSEAWSKIEKGAWLVGVGAATSAQAETALVNESLHGGVHNALLQALLEGGVIELLAQVGLYVWLIRSGMKSKNTEGIVLIAVILGIFTRNLAESNGLLFGLLNNFIVFLSWYVVISLMLAAQKTQEIRA